MWSSHFRTIQYMNLVPKDQRGQSSPVFCVIVLMWTEPAVGLLAAARFLAATTAAPFVEAPVRGENRKWPQTSAFAAEVGFSSQKRAHVYIQRSFESFFTSPWLQRNRAHVETLQPRRKAPPGCLETFGSRERRFPCFSSHSHLPINSRSTRTRTRRWQAEGAEVTAKVTAEVTAKVTAEVTGEVTAEVTAEVTELRPPQHPGPQQVREALPLQEGAASVANRKRGGSSQSRVIRPSRHVRDTRLWARRWSESGRNAAPRRRVVFCSVSPLLLSPKP